MTPKHNSNDAENVATPKRSHWVLSLSEKVKVLKKERQKKSYAVVAKVYGKNKSIHEIVKKEKYTHANFTVVLQIAKVWPVCNKCLVNGHCGIVLCLFAKLVIDLGVILSFTEVLADHPALFHPGFVSVFFPTFRCYQNLQWWR